MMEGTRRGGDRQELHERVRVHSQASADAMKGGARENDLFERIASDELFAIDRETIAAMAHPGDYTGLAMRQTELFLTEEIDPLIAAHRDLVSSETGEVRV